MCITQEQADEKMAEYLSWWSIHWGTTLGDMDLAGCAVTLNWEIAAKGMRNLIPDHVFGLARKYQDAYIEQIAPSRAPH